MTPAPKPIPWILPILLLGVIHLGYLLTLPEREIFLSGDGGVKLLLVRQMASGLISPELSLPLADARTAGLHDFGLYPFPAPFVYHIEARRVVSFPLYFPGLSAAAYRMAGWRGLYILPVLGVVLCWGAVIRVIRRCDLQGAAAACATAALIPASPLTIYGATFWEHAPAAALAALPVGLIARREGEPLSARAAFLTGLISGGGVFLRPEAGVPLSAAAVALLLFSPATHRRQALGYCAGLLIAVVAFACSNQGFYGHPLGVHSHQMLGSGNRAAGKLAESGTRAADMLRLWMRTWPPVLFLAAGVPPALMRASPHTRTIRDLALVVLVSLLLIPLMVPNDGGEQWGPRYLLVLLPWCAVLLGLTLDALVRSGGRGFGISLILTFVILAAAGAKTNLADGTMRLRNDYRDDYVPAARIIEAREEKQVLFSQPWNAMELARMAGTKDLLWMGRQSPESVRGAFRAAGVEAFLYVSESFEGVPAEFRPCVRIGGSDALEVFLVADSESTGGLTPD